MKSSFAVEVCQLLASHRAHVDQAIEFRQPSGSLMPRNNWEDAETSQRILEVLALASHLEACKKYLSFKGLMVGYTVLGSKYNAKSQNTPFTKAKDK
jgi:hypothetical protein